MAEPRNYHVVTIAGDGIGPEIMTASGPDVDVFAGEVGTVTS